MLTSPHPNQCANIINMGTAKALDLFLVFVNFRSELQSGKVLIIFEVFPASIFTFTVMLSPKNNARPVLGGRYYWWIYDDISLTF